MQIWLFYAYTEILWSIIKYTLEDKLVLHMFIWQIRYLGVYFSCRQRPKTVVNQMFTALSNHWVRNPAIGQIIPGILNDYVD